MLHRQPLHSFRLVRPAILAVPVTVYSFPFRVQQPRKQGGLGDMTIPLLADSTHQISRAYGVLKEDEGLAFRYALLPLR